MLAWTDTCLTVVVPALGRLDPTTVNGVTVQNRFGSTTRTFAVHDRPTVATFTRLEPHARTDDLEQGLRLGLQAQVYDAAWLLARQWQFGEFKADDAGTPLQVRVRGEAAPFARYRGGTAPPQDMPNGVPLQELVEREPPLRDQQGTPQWSARFAVAAGLQFLRMLTARFDAQQAATYRAAYTAQYALAAPSGTALAGYDAAGLAFVDVAVGRVPDGRTLARALEVALPAPRGKGQLPAKPQVTGAANKTAMRDMIGAWFQWVESFVGAPSAPEAWRSDRMEYTFAVSAETAKGEVVLTAPAYDGRGLEWHDLSVDSRVSLRAAGGARPAARPIDTTSLASWVAFPGMPSPSFWAFEDRRVDFGAVEAGAAELTRIVLVEFATVYGNDWLLATLPPTPVGSLIRIDSVDVTTTFNETLPLGPLAGGARAKGPFHLFELSRAVETPVPAVDPATLLLLPPTLADSAAGEPLEEVALIRDELANLAWGVERVVESAAGTRRDRLAAYQARRQHEADAAVQTPARASLRYTVMRDVPDYWIPFVPRIDGQRKLQRAAMTRPTSAGETEPVVPWGRLLAPAELELFDEEVPREGVMLQRRYRSARWTDGSTRVWLARVRGPGRGDGSSGLRFDVLET